MIDYFLEVFGEACVQFVGWIPGVVGVWLLINLVADLLFRER